MGRGGRAGRGGAGRGGGNRGTNAALSPGNFTCVCGCVCLQPNLEHVTNLKAALSKLHMRMPPALDDLPTLQIRSAEAS